MSSDWQEVTDALLAQLTVERVIGFPTATLTITYFFYGIYMVLTILCVCLLRHDQFENRQFYLLSTLLLFAICTIMVVDVTVFRIRESALEYYMATTKNTDDYFHYAMHDKMKLGYYTLYYVVPPLANIVAESMLIHRCYLIWGCRKRVAIPLVILSSLSSLLHLGAGITAIVALRNLSSPADTRVTAYADALKFLGQLTSAVVNALVTVLSAGRIWQTNRQLQKHLPFAKDEKRFSTTLRIILESGIIYPIVMIVQIAVDSPPKGQLPPVDLYPAVVLSAGLAPTLALLRAQLVKLSERAGSKRDFEGLSDIRFDSAQLGPGKSSANRSISLGIYVDSDAEAVKMPEPVVHSRQGAGPSSSFSRKTQALDVEKRSL